MSKIEKFEDLKIWEDGINLSVDIYKMLSNCKDFSLRDQIQRSSVSIPSNIAEGLDRQTNNEFIRYLRIAKGSCEELRTQLIIAQKIGIISDSNIVEHTRLLSSMIQKLITYRTNINNNKVKIKNSTTLKPSNHSTF